MTNYLPIRTEPLDNLPVLTEVVGGEPLNDIPTLTEVVSEAQDSCIQTPAIGEESLQRLTERLEAHLEDLFTQKLQQRLETLQQQAIEETVAELKAELPQLLRDMLNTSR
jgi:hypothetical protein